MENVILLGTNMP